MGYFVGPHANVNENHSNTVIDYDTGGSEMDSEEAASNLMFEFITEGVLLIVISILGFIGNSMSVYVLLRPSVRGIFSNILMGLASFDALFLLCAIGM